MKNTPPLNMWILVLILAGLSLLYLTALTPDKFGFYHDDGVYVVTAKALATGQGYRIISLPDEPPQTKFPPLYPFLLSLIWRVYPDFPENLLPMMLLSLLATLVWLVLTWHYLTRRSYARPWQALLIVALVGINWRTVILATGIYSEMVYSALSVVALWLAEKYEKELRGWIWGSLVAVITGLVFLTRVSGIALLIAVVLYFVFRRKFAKASLLLCVGGSFAVAWSGWIYVNGQLLNNINASFYTSYFQDFLENVSDFSTLLNVVGKNAFMLIFVTGPLMILGLDYSQTDHFLLGRIIIISLTFVFIAGGFLRHLYFAGVSLLHFYMILYLTLHLFWPYTPYDRFIMPILPFILLFLIFELEFLISLVRKNLASTPRVAAWLSGAFFFLVLMSLGSVVLYNHSSIVRWSQASKAVYAGRAYGDTQAIRWIKSHTDSSDVLLCDRDPLYYLHTGRKAMRLFQVGSTQTARGKPFLHEQAKIIFRIINETGARYLILTSNDFEFEQQPHVARKNFRRLIEQYPQTFEPAFESSDGRAAIYKIKVSPL